MDSTRDRCDLKSWFGELLINPERVEDVSELFEELELMASHADNGRRSRSRTPKFRFNFALT